MNKIKIVLLGFVLVAMMSACKKETKSTVNTPTTVETPKGSEDTVKDNNVDLKKEENQNSVSEKVEPSNMATLVLDMSFGDENGDANGKISRYEYGYEGEITVDILAKGLSELTGLDFDLKDSSSGKGGASADWSYNASLFQDLSSWDRKDEFQVTDQEMLAWLMLDSLQQSIIESFGGENLEVFYSMDGNKPLVVPAISYISEFPIETPYMGSTFYLSHIDGRGDKVNDSDSSIDEDKAMDILFNEISSMMLDGQSIVSYGFDTVNRKDCWKFAVGKNTPEKFTAEHHFAVTDTGKIYVLDILTNEYVPYTDLYFSDPPETE